MELVLLGLLALGTVLLLNWIGVRGTPDDNREPYARDGEGNIWALYVAGPVGNVPNHEAFIHAPRGHPTPHQNPAVNTFTAYRWFFIFPFPEEREERWYPVTTNGIAVNLDEIRQRISQARLQRRQDVDLLTMPRWAEKRAIRRENGEQLGRGVPSGRIQKRGV